MTENRIAPEMIDSTYLKLQASDITDIELQAAFNGSELAEHLKATIRDDFVSAIRQGHDETVVLVGIFRAALTLGFALGQQAPVTGGVN